MTTALICHPEFLGHIPPPGHPERVARYDAVLGALHDMDLLQVRAPLAAEEDILRVHPRSYVDDLKRFAPEGGWRAIDSDTYLSAGSLAAAWRAVGAATRGVDMVLAGEAANAFALTRPPGHHAEAETAMGFCLFGTVAAAAKYALEHHGLERVAILDFDVHHGNGTQALVEDDPRILFCSSHEWPLWPGTGAATDTGPHGTVVNMTLPTGTDGAGLIAAWERDAFPRIAAHKPQLILVSAGFDAHRDDPLAGLRLETEDFATLTGRICDLADHLCSGRVVSALEGGYDLDALAAGAAAHVRTLEERGR
ncbi:histone deacetylase family protein [Limimaricola pyoseonensis]|uniref:Acetoin utilization deacetylase AcuC n=1 Tax=Limimaricola pyoseonensis TaxID=521013 RepID=A0A1G7EVL7_9RHOB|nr:histone deacetylase family protein [Limimaricola pyoseonensis]SDE67708.1 Acetoin utilization deacetylase AcuC [Limimaricola pyoseonensis]